MLLPKLTTRQFFLRLKEGEARGFIDLTQHDLSDVNLEDQEIRSLWQSVLRDASRYGSGRIHFIDCTGSDVSGMNFTGADLTGVIFSRATAVRTIFARANLTDCAMDATDLSHADFRETILTHTKLFDARITGANFTGADLRETQGLGFLSDDPNTAIARLAEASSIMHAHLPDKLEEHRRRIQALIQVREHRPHIIVPQTWEEEVVEMAD